MYQSDAVAQQYGNLGYLAAITSVIGMAILSCGVFIQTMLLNVLAICIAGECYHIAPLRRNSYNFPPSFPTQTRDAKYQWDGFRVEESP